MKALEIGGPSDLFGKPGSLPIYSCLESIDNCNYSARTLWQSEAAKFNRTLVCEGTELPVDDAAYDCVIASHCLEHIANPIKALVEWRRILREGGLLLLILPHRDYTFDWRRPVTSLEHLQDDFQCGTPETDLSHMDEVLALHDLSRDPAAGTPEQFKERRLKNAEFRAIHHQVFVPETAAQLVRSAGFSIVRQDVQQFHIVTLAGKPELKLHSNPNSSLLRSTGRLAVNGDDDQLPRDRISTEIAKEMKALKPQAPILIVSGMEEESCDLEFADGFCSKGEAPYVLLDTVARLLKR